MSDEFLKPPPETLTVNRSDSRCENCGGGATPWQKTHDENIGYTERTPCGIEFKYIQSDYIGLNMKQWAEENRPDLEWIGSDDSVFYGEKDERSE